MMRVVDVVKQTTPSKGWFGGGGGGSLGGGDSGGSSGGGSWWWYDQCGRSWYASAVPVVICSDARNMGDCNVCIVWSAT